MNLYLYQLPPKEFAKAQFISGDNNYALEDYVLVNKYHAELEDVHEALEDMFKWFNVGVGYNHRSMSVSDVVEVNGKFYWCDHIGFTEIEW